MATLNDFGAPGTTATDMAEGVYSEADVQVKDPRTKQISKPVASFSQGDKHYQKKQLLGMIIKLLQLMIHLLGKILKQPHLLREI